MSRQDIKVDVEELTLIESGQYGDQFMRPYVTEVKGGLMDKIQERFSKSKRFTPSILASIANQFIVPDYRVRGLIEIPHGWGTRRGRFILTLSIRLGTGDRLRQVVMGFTNSVGFTPKNTDPEMEFYVNNTFMLHERTMRDRDGRSKVMWVPSNSNDVIADSDNSGLRRRSSTLFTMRPEDVYSTLDSSQTSKLVDDLTDLRTTLSKNAIKSSTSNRLGSRFMAKVLHGRQKAIDNEDYANAAVEINASAQGYVAEAYSSDDIFLSMISNIRGTTMTLDNFTMRDLLQIDPDADRRTDRMLLDDDAVAMTRYDEDDINVLSGGEEWDRVAALVGIAVPALMVEHGIHDIAFKAHNQMVGNEWLFLPENARSLVRGMDISPFIDQFEERLIDELLMPVTGGNRYDIGLEVTCRAFGEIDFTMFWDGSRRGRYVIPCFTNSRASPIITDSTDDVKNMARDFNDLFDEFLPADTLGRGGSGFSF